MAIGEGSQPNFAKGAIGGAGLPSLANHDGGSAALPMNPLGSFPLNGSSSATGRSDGALSSGGNTLTFGSSGGASISTEMIIAIAAAVAFVVYLRSKK